jgi:hypothetical protein
VEAVSSTENGEQKEAMENECKIIMEKRKDPSWLKDTIRREAKWYEYIGDRCGRGRQGPLEDVTCIDNRAVRSMATC